VPLVPHQLADFLNSHAVSSEHAERCARGMCHHLAQHEAEAIFHAVQHIFLLDGVVFPASLYVLDGFHDGLQEGLWVGLVHRVVSLFLPHTVMKRSVFFISFLWKAHDDGHELDVAVVSIPLHSLECSEVCLVEAHVPLHTFCLWMQPHDAAGVSGEHGIGARGGGLRRWKCATYTPVSIDGSKALSSCRAFEEPQALGGVHSR